jgi:hypothetical protein
MKQAHHQKGSVASRKTFLRCRGVFCDALIAAARSQLLIAFSALVVAGCATQSTNAGKSLAAYQHVAFAKVDLFDQRWVPPTEQMLQRYGFIISKDTNAPSLLLCKIAIIQVSVWNFHAHISLWDQDEMLVSGEARNPGFGNAMVPDATIHGIFDGALRRLEQEIKKTRIATADTKLR